MFFIPWNWGVVVKERRLMEQRICGGRERRRRVGVRGEGAVELGIGVCWGGGI